MKGIEGFKLVKCDTQCLFLVFVVSLDCEIQEERSPAGHMDVVEALQEGEAIEVESKRIIKNAKQSRAKQFI